MKVICTQENLKAGLSMVGRIISPNNTLPILNNLLLKTENGQLKISSTNLEVAISTTIRCKTEQEGEVTVLAKTIQDLVNNLPNKNITLESKNNQVSLDAENYHTSLKTLPSEEFPLIPQIETKEVIRLDAGEFKTAIDQVVFAVSTNQTQPEISGVLLSLKNNILKIVATDRYRLAERKLSLEKDLAHSQEVIVPHKTMVELSRIIGGNKGQVEMVVNDTQISLGFEQTQIVSRLIDGQYPDYEQIIPQNFTTTITTEKHSLVNALRAGGIFSQNSSSVRLEFDPGKSVLTVIAESSELGKSVVELPSQIEGMGGFLVLNYRYILDSLSIISEDTVIIKITNDNSPSLILPEGRDNYIYLVMPIKS
jgi:DNA polymerase III subunit beta